MREDFEFEGRGLGFLVATQAHASEQNKLSAAAIVAKPIRGAIMTVSFPNFGWTIYPDKRKGRRSGIGQHSGNKPGDISSTPALADHLEEPDLLATVTTFDFQKYRLDQEIP